MFSGFNFKKKSYSEFQKDVAEKNKKRGVFQRKKYKLISGVEHKHCNKCKKWHPLSNFVKDKYCWDGLKRHCTPCRKKANKRLAYSSYKRKESYRKFKDARLKYQKEYRGKNREVVNRNRREDLKRRQQSCENIWKLTPSEKYTFSGFVLRETQDDCVLPRGK